MRVAPFMRVGLVFVALTLLALPAQAAQLITTTQVGEGGDPDILPHCPVAAASVDPTGADVNEDCVFGILQGIPPGESSPEPQQDEPAPDDPGGP